jgi:hypothetical protein
LKNYFWKILIITLVLINISCDFGSKETYLYDQVGFSPNRIPEQENDKVLIRKVPPDYYFQNRNYPNSRFYNNPYDILPRNYQRPYDIDQYYTPPTNYQNIERN